MMLGSPIPVRLPYDSNEDRLIVRRQNKLARDIDIIQQKIRNNVYSAGEGNQRIQFKRAEIAQLQRYRGSKRVDSGRLSPAPKTKGIFQKKKPITKPANKYNPYANDKVGKGTEPADTFEVEQVKFNRADPELRSTSWAEDDRAGMTSQRNQRSSGNKPPAPNDRSALNPRGYSPANYYSRYVENYTRRKITKSDWNTGLRPMVPSAMRRAFENDAKRAWKANKPLPKLVSYKGDKPTSTFDKAKDEAKSSFDKAKDEAKSISKKATEFFSKFKSSKKNDEREQNRGDPSFKDVEDIFRAPVAQSSLTKKVVDQRKNPYAKAYGPTFGKSDRSKTGGRYVIYNGQFYGPKSSSPLTVARFLLWNKQNKVAVKQANKTIRVSDFAGFAGFAGMPDFMTRQRSRANRETTLMRKRAGAKVRFDNPRMTNATQMRSWETYAKPEDIAMIKSLLPAMTGLEKFPELTAEGNAMMIELVSAGTDQKKMQIVANKLATDLMNKSGYFVKKYNVEVDPLQRKVKVSEMSGFAGGLTKTRNSMQRLLK